MHTFAEDFFQLTPLLELPDMQGEIGMAGLCLEPEHGYVFVTYAYQDRDGFHRNGLSRFQSTPGVFGLESESRVDLLPVLRNFPSSTSHQIGPMVKSDGYLFVCIGDAKLPRNSRDLDSPGGKILRMTYDGLPAEGNPFRVDDDPSNIRNFIWAIGLRNPFSLKLVEGHMFVAENGPGVDRFVEVKAGEDLLYDGTDASIATNSMFVWKRSVSPVQMDYNPAAASALGLPDDLSNSFFIALSGSPIDPPGMSDHGSKSVVEIAVDVATGKVVRAPHVILRYRGAGKQLPVGLSFGPDGLYIAPLMPDSEGNSPIIKMRYSPASEHPHFISLNRPDLLQKYSCSTCHKFDDNIGGSIGPPIDRSVLEKRLLRWLSSREYAEQIERVDELQAEPFLSHAKRRSAVLNAEGTEKVRLWLVNRLQYPRFDQKESMMPELGITREEADIITHWLLSPDPTAEAKSLREVIRGWLPTAGKRHVAFSYLSGGVLIVLLIYWLTGIPRRPL